MPKPGDIIDLPSMKEVREHAQSTLTSMEASPEAKALVLEIRDELRNERMWAIAEKHLKTAYSRGLAVGLLSSEPIDKSGLDA